MLIRHMLPECECVSLRPLAVVEGLQSSEIKQWCSNKTRIVREQKWKWKGLGFFYLDGLLHALRRADKRLANDTHPAETSSG